MAMYYCAIDRNEKTIMEAPRAYACKSPGVYHPQNPFPAMVIMKNIQGYNYEIINDSDGIYEMACSWKDVSLEVYEELIKIHPQWDEYA